MREGPQAIYVVIFGNRKKYTKFGIFTLLEGGLLLQINAANIIKIK